MIAVAIVGLLSWGELARRRSATYRALARGYAMSEEGTRGSLARAEARADALAPSGNQAAIHLAGRQVAYERRWVDYYAVQRRRYQYAAAHPWLSPGPDPDPPAPK
jgi:hypothetical protein